MNGSPGRRGSRAGDSFLAHWGLIAVACGAAMAEAWLLVAFAPAARALAPQVTGLAPLGYFHDLRWLYTSQRSWAGFVGLLAGLLLARSALNAALIRLSWPRGLRPPPPLVACGAALVVTGLGFLLMSPIVSLTFGVAIVPFSWPFLAMVPALLLLALPLSHAGVISAWWRVLPPLAAVGWLLVEFAVLSAAAAVTGACPPAVAVPAAGVAGLVNARGWYGVTRAFASSQVPVPASSRAAALARAWGAGLIRASAPGSAHARGRHQDSPPGPARPPSPGRMGRNRRVPAAPFALAVIIVLVVAATRLMFVLGSQGWLLGANPSVSALAANGMAPAPAPVGGRPAGHAHPQRPILEVAGFGSWCCAHDRALAKTMAGMLVEQFSYRGLSHSGQPLPYGRSASDVGLSTLGDRMAAQIWRLHRETGQRVDVVAESEGTLGVYALLAQHPQVPVGSVALLSPIMAPGQARYQESAGSGAVARDELHAVIWFIGGLSPFGSSGAQRLIDSVNNVGARFADSAEDSRVQIMQLVPLADAVTLPNCHLPPDVLVVPAVHGRLLGDPAALRLVREFLTGQPVRPAATLQTTARLVAAAATAWRMPAPASPSPPCQG
jgi:hypothetical protein